jgi:hypothetical protein
MVDTDGSSKLSKTISAVSAHQFATITPSVGNGILSIETNDYQEDIDIQIFDITGRLLKNITTKGEQSLINIQDLRNGFYIFHIKMLGKVSVLKYVKT